MPLVSGDHSEPVSWAIGSGASGAVLVGNTDPLAAFTPVSEGFVETYGYLLNEDNSYILNEDSYKIIVSIDSGLTTGDHSASAVWIVGDMV